MVYYHLFARLISLFAMLKECNSILQFIRDIIFNPGMKLEFCFSDHCITNRNRLRKYFLFCELFSPECQWIYH
jgi:hypothetical protein